MKLNWVETLVMNNPIRAAVQRKIEATGLAKLAPRSFTNARTLIIGCGRGVDIEVAFEQFAVSHVVAVDLDDAQVARAKKRLGSRFGDKLRIVVGDVEKLDFEDESFDLVLDFGIIHHVPNWQGAIREIYRVLAQNGQFAFEEIPKNELDRPIYRIFTVHPTKNRFYPEDFKSECENAGLKLDGRLENFRIGFLQLFRGVAVKE